MKISICNKLLEFCIGIEFKTTSTRKSECSKYARLLRVLLVFAITKLPVYSPGSIYNWDSDLIKTLGLLFYLLAITSCKVSFSNYI